MSLYSFSNFRFCFVFYPRYWVKSGKEKSVKLVLVHDAIGLDRVIRVAGGTLKPTKLLLLGALCSTNPHCALQISSAKIASRDHSRANWPQSVIRNDAHCACKKDDEIKNSLSIFTDSKAEIEIVLLNAPLRLYKCNWYMVMGMPTGRRTRVGRLFHSPWTHSLAMHSNRFVALNGMVHVDFWNR